MKEADSSEEPIGVKELMIVPKDKNELLPLHNTPKTHWPKGVREIPSSRVDHQIGDELILKEIIPSLKPTMEIQTRTMSCRVLVTGKSEDQKIVQRSI